MLPDMETALCIAAETASPARDLQTECLRLEQICMGALRDEVMAWPKPGLVTPVWFTPTMAGQFEIACSQLCGLGHYRMMGVITVESEEAFRRFLADEAAALR